MSKSTLRGGALRAVVLVLLVFMVEPVLAQDEIAPVGRGKSPRQPEILLRVLSPTSPTNRDTVVFNRDLQAAHGFAQRAGSQMHAFAHAGQPDAKLPPSQPMRCCRSSRLSPMPRASMSRPATYRSRDGFLPTSRKT